MEQPIDVQPIKTGIFSDISNDIYHALPIISHSGLTYFKRSPAHYQQYLRTPSKSTPAKELGTAIHRAILEPHLFKDFVLTPKVDKRTKEGKIKWIEFLGTLKPEQTPLDQEKFVIIEGILESLYKHPVASALLKGGKREQTFIWKCPVTDVLTKCRPDLITDSNILVDVKSTQDASPKEFRRSIFKYNYLTQTAHYLNGVGYTFSKVLSEFVHLVVETEAPFGVALYTLDDASIASGADEVMRLLEIYSQCKKTDQWASYPTDIQNISAFAS